MAEFIGIGDLHLTDEAGKGGLANYIPEPDAYVMSEVERCLRWATKRSITICFLYGDICETPRMSYAAHLAFIKTLKTWPGIMFYLVLGNHDKQGRESSAGHSMQLVLELGLPNLKVITEDEVIKIQRAEVKFCPWPSKAFNPKMLNVGHTEVSGSRGDSGRVMDGEGLSKSKAVVCMGHLHTPHQVRNTYFSGTLYQTNFGEPLPKFFHHIQWRSVEDYEINNIPFDPRYKLFNCIIESEDDIKALPRDPRHLVKLVIKDGADVVVPDMPNIVITKAFKTKHELATILTEDLMQGSELVIRTSDFFREWLAAQSIPQHLKIKTSKLRKAILYGSK